VNLAAFLRLEIASAKYWNHRRRSVHPALDGSSDWNETVLDTIITLHSQPRFVVPTGKAGS
jgi:hypothetical protein